MVELKLNIINPIIYGFNPFQVIFILFGVLLISSIFIPKEYFEISREYIGTIGLSIFFILEYIK
jgi:hypothetical protein|tara:strand:- start:14187 stop:14378 length:192 start_codon:yes stop_codon:yes gene_type:complete